MLLTILSLGFNVHPSFLNIVIIGAPEGTRTLTHKALVPKTSVSTIPPQARGQEPRLSRD